MKIPSKHIDKIFNYKGKWDIPSHCGIKIVRQNKNTIVIATEIYETNPGTSVTDYTAELATFICSKEKIAFDELIFIVHTPDRKSKLEFYKETFDRVDFNIQEKLLKNPKWKRIPKNEVDELIFD